MKRTQVVLVITLLLSSVFLAACSGISFPSAQAETSEEIELDPTKHYQAMRAGFEVDIDDYQGGLHYSLVLDVTIEDDNLTVLGVEQVRYQNNSSDALDEVVFRLYPNGIYNLPVLRVNSVVVEEQEVDFSLDVNDSVLRVPLSAALEPGEQIDMKLTFALSLKSGVDQYGYSRLSYLNEIASLSNFIPLVSIYEDGEWWMSPMALRGDPAFSEVGLFDITLFAPEDLQLISTGVTIAESSEDGIAAYEIVSGPVRDVSIALGPDFELISATQDGVTINIWSLPGAEDADEAGLEFAQEAVAIFDEQFGHYPFSELDIIQAPILAGGIEYPGLIYVADRYWDVDELFYEVVIVHEIAHQWWYSMVGNNQVEEPWLDEGLTEYSVEVYYREIFGPGGGESVRQFYEEELVGYLNETGIALPVGLPAYAYDPQQYRVYVYSGGALFFGELQDEHGYDKMQDFLQQYYADNRYGIVTNQSLGAAISEFFGADAAELYEGWVFGG